MRQNFCTVVYGDQMQRGMHMLSQGQGIATLECE